ncbi:MAG: 2-dehydropantoate 2-reductase N-terminal domain-containing protein [Patescibacteria group bacterium]
MKRTVAIIGAGELGSAFGKILELLGHRVYLWDLVPEKRNTGKSLEEIIRQAELVFLTVPSWSLSAALGSVKNFLNPKTKLICASKGMEKTGKTVPEIIQESIANDFAILSGPMIAEELDLGLPGFSLVAAGGKELFEELNLLFLGSGLRLQYASDLNSVAYAGILKNVYALILGLAHGLSQGDNVRGFLISEILKEWEDLAKILGIDSSVLRGLAGQGDFIATSISRYSRNCQLGEKLAKGNLDNLTSEGFESLAPLIKLVREKTNQPLPKFLNGLERIIIKKHEPKKVFQELIEI